LIVDVKEAKTGEFSFGGGYSSVDKLIGFVEIARKILILKISTLLPAQAGFKAKGAVGFGKQQF